jgi:hypothetical protein
MTPYLYQRATWFVDIDVVRHLIMGLYGRVICHRFYFPLIQMVEDEYY